MSEMIACNADVAFDTIHSSAKLKRSNVCYRQ